MTKAELRREMRTRLASVDPDRERKSQAIVAAIAAHPRLAGRPRIALFSPLPTEPDVEGLWKGAAGRFCYPRITRDRMEFVEVEKREELATSTWHPQIREHTRGEARIVPPSEIEVILVPGLAFTKRGHRLGRGGGFYDRYLGLLPATTLKLGVCFAFQVVNALPAEPHDQPVDTVATEDGILR